MFFFFNYVFCDSEVVSSTTSASYSNYDLLISSALFIGAILLYFYCPSRSDISTYFSSVVGKASQHALDSSSSVASSSSSISESVVSSNIIEPGSFCLSRFVALFDNNFTIILDLSSKSLTDCLIKINQVSGNIKLSEKIITFKLDPAILSNNSLTVGDPIIVKAVIDILNTKVYSSIQSVIQYDQKIGFFINMNYEELCCLLHYLTLSVEAAPSIQFSQDFYSALTIFGALLLNRLP